MAGQGRAKQRQGKAGQNKGRAKGAGQNKGRAEGAGKTQEKKGVATFLFIENGIYTSSNSSAARKQKRDWAAGSGSDQGELAASTGDRQQTNRGSGQAAGHRIWQDEGRLLRAVQKRQYPTKRLGSGSARDSTRFGRLGRGARAREFGKSLGNASVKAGQGIGQGIVQRDRAGMMKQGKKKGGARPRGPKKQKTVAASRW